MNRARGPECVMQKMNRPGGPERKAGNEQLKYYADSKKTPLYSIHSGLPVRFISHQTLCICFNRIDVYPQPFHWTKLRLIHAFDAVAHSGFYVADVADEPL